MWFNLLPDKGGIASRELIDKITETHDRSLHEFVAHSKCYCSFRQREFFLSNCKIKVQAQAYLLMTYAKNLTSKYIRN